jgi:hypothetical protein
MKWNSARPLACDVTAPATAPLGAALALVGYMRTGITVGLGGTGSACPFAAAAGAGAVTPGTGYGRPSS